MLHSTYSDDFLMHHGVKGMRWGVRKDRKNQNYSYQQRTRDRKLYGHGAEKRINKRMNNGESIQSARHNEVVRKDRKKKAKRVTANVAAAAVVTGGSAAVYALLKKHGADATFSSNMAEHAVSIGKSIISAILR